MTQKNDPFLFLHDDQKGMYYVFLVNPTNYAYTNIKRKMGSFFSGDAGTDDLLQIGPSISDLGKLPKNSYIQIDKIHWMARDFTSFYDLELTREDDDIQHITGEVLKYNPPYPKVMIAYGLNKEGWILT